MSPQEWISIIKDCLIGLAAIAGIFVGLQGLKTWKRTLTGTSRYTRAKELLKAVYSVRNGFLHVRNPGIFNYEYPEELLNTYGILDDTKRKEGALHVYTTRMKVLYEAFSKLEDQSLEAEVEWDSENMLELIKNLRRCKAEVEQAIRCHVELLDRRYDLQENMEYHREQSEKIYHKGEKYEDDTLTREICSCIREYESKLKPIIKRGG